MLEMLFSPFSGHLNNTCFNDFTTCQQGISFSVWLQFTVGMYVMSISKSNSSVLLVQVHDNNKLLIQLTTGSNLWLIKRDCFPVGWFHLTVTWNKTGKLHALLSKALATYQGPVSRKS